MRGGDARNAICIICMDSVNFVHSVQIPEFAVGCDSLPLVLRVEWR